MPLNLTKICGCFWSLSTKGILYLLEQGGFMQVALIANILWLQRHRIHRLKVELVPSSAIPEFPSKNLGLSPRMSQAQFVSIH